MAKRPIQNLGTGYQALLQNYFPEKIYARSAVRILYVYKILNGTNNDEGFITLFPDTKDKSALLTIALQRIGNGIECLILDDSLTTITKKRSVFDITSTNEITNYLLSTFTNVEDKLKPNKNEMYLYSFVKFENGHAVDVSDILIMDDRADIKASDGLSDHWNLQLSEFWINSKLPEETELNYIIDNNSEKFWANGDPYYIGITTQRKALYTFISARKIENQVIKQTKMLLANSKDKLYRIPAFPSTVSESGITLSIENANLGWWELSNLSASKENNLGVEWRMDIKPVDCPGIIGKGLFGLSTSETFSLYYPAFLLFKMSKSNSGNVLSTDGVRNVIETFKDADLNCELLQGRIDLDFTTSFGESNKSSWKLINGMAPIVLQQIIKMKYGGSVKRSGIVEKFNSLTGGDATTLDVGFSSYEPTNKEDTSHNFYWYLDFLSKLDTSRESNDDEMIQIFYNLQLNDNETQTFNGVVNKIGWEKILNSITDIPPSASDPPPDEPLPYAVLWLGDLEFNNSTTQFLANGLKWDDFTRLELTYRAQSASGCTQREDETVLIDIAEDFSTINDFQNIYMWFYYYARGNCVLERQECNFTRSGDNNFELLNYDSNKGRPEKATLIKVEGFYTAPTSDNVRINRDFSQYSNEEIEIIYYLDTQKANATRLSPADVGAKSADVKSFEIGAIYNDTYTIKFYNSSYQQTGYTIKSVSPNLKNQALSRKIFLF